MNKLKFYLLFLALWLGQHQAFSQTFARATVFLNGASMNQLNDLGIDADHGELRPHYSFTSDFSQADIAKLKQAGYSVQILIEDVIKHYQNQVQSQRAINATNYCKPTITYPTPLNFKLGSFAGYYTYQETWDILDSMRAKYPQLISVKEAISTQKTVEGRMVYWVRISDNPDSEEAEPQILYNALHHAREPASLSQLIFHMWYLLENYQTDSLVKALVNNTELYFIPIVNPDGYEFNRAQNPTGGGLWRKNRTVLGNNNVGVDLNRNYGWFWGFDNTGSSNNPSQDTYRGPSAFSELETQWVKSFCEMHQFKIAVNNHCYGNLVVYPWGYKENFFTPDSLTFKRYASFITQDNKFIFGTPNQTVGYVGNGAADDWMYGEQNSKTKILSFTPEAGNSDDGFWPAQTKIESICKNSLGQNLYANMLLLNCGRIQDTENKIIPLNTSHIHFELEQLGFEQKDFTVKITALNNAFTTSPNPIILTGLGLLQKHTDSVSIQLNPSLKNGDVIQYAISLNNGYYTITDTITKWVGNPATAFFSDGNNTSSFVNNTGFSTTSTTYYTPTGSITDSPNGNYTSSSNKSLTSGNIDLTDATSALLSFYTKWDIEKNYDYAQVLVGVNGNYTPLCGKYTEPGTANQLNGQPLYHGTQTNWVKEEMDLSAYKGQTITLRFTLKSDQGVNMDGIYLDEIQVVKFISDSSLLVDNLNKSWKLAPAYPNPASAILYVPLPLNESCTVSLINALGQCVFIQPNTNNIHTLSIPTSTLANGIYQCVIETAKNKKNQRISILNQHNE